MADNVGRRGTPSDDGDAFDAVPPFAGRRGSAGRGYEADDQPDAPPSRRGGRFADDEHDPAPSSPGRFARTSGRFAERQDDGPDDEQDAAPTRGGRFAASEEPTGRFARFDEDDAEDADGPTGRFALDDPDDEPTGRFALPSGDDEPTGRFAWRPADADDAVNDTADEDEPTGRFALPSHTFTDPGDQGPRNQEPGDEEDEPASDEPTGRFARLDDSLEPPAPGHGARFTVDRPKAPEPEAEASAERPMPSTITPLPQISDEPTSPVPARPDPKVQPPLSGLTPPEVTFTPEPPDPEPTSPEATAADSQASPALFDWEDLRPRTTTSTAMASPETPKSAPDSPAEVADVDAPAVEVPWTPEPAATEPADTPTPTTAGGGGGARHRSPLPPADDEDPRRRWYALGALAVVLALIVGVLFFVLRPGAEQANPGPTPTAATDGPSPSTGATPATSTTPSASTQPSATPSPTMTPTPTPTTPAPLILDLGDANVTVLPTWQLYADEKVQDDRRLVRLKHLETDIRIQIVTLTSIDGDLDTACSDLMAEQRQTYSDVVLSETVSVAVGDGASGVACGFTGTRTSDDVAMKVDFTIVRRDADQKSIVFRDTVPQSVPADAPARAELATMECGAADTFGVAIKQCAG